MAQAFRPASAMAAPGRRVGVDESGSGKAVDRNERRHVERAALRRPVRQRHRHHAAAHAIRVYLELHRQTLETATNRRIPAADWRLGFGLALADLLINRWAMYTLVHAVRRQPFLERVLQNTDELKKLASDQGGKASDTPAE